MEHTPGPWHPTAGTEIISDTDLSIAMMNVRREEWCENARLIAAAPELLAAIKACHAIVMETYTEADATPLHEDLLPLLTAAIAKARGAE